SSGFQTFAADNRTMLATHWLSGSQLVELNGSTMAPVQPTRSIGMLGGTSTLRPTHPDWSWDGRTVYLVGGMGIAILSGRYEETHFTAGSIYQMSYERATDTFSPPMPVVISAGPDENNFYPAVAPDGRFLVFNRAVGMMNNIATLDAFHNPNAQLF